jgi:ABC-2 type transport system ATP-binding protein
MNRPLAVLDNVSKQFLKQGPLAIETLSATISKGTMVGLVGPDGSGKTTLIRLMAGLLKPSSGFIKIAGFDTIKDAEHIHKLVGYMPQKFGLYEDLSVQQNLNLYADLRGLVKEERSATFKKLLSFTALGPFTDRLARALSGGMKQKLGLACALLTKPTLLLLDEPSVGVDPLSRRQLWNMVQELLHEDISVVWSTAYLDEAEKCDSVLLLYEGKLLHNGPPMALTQTMDGRTFKITNISTNRRELLFNCLSQPNVLDGVIQARDVRLSFRKDVPHALALQDPQATMVPTPARFEDAFIDILGGSGGPSLLAEHTPAIVEKEKIIINTNALTKRFGSFTAVDHISLQINRGEIFGLLGPNGAGKTTMFKMMCGLLKPTSGTASVNGVDLLTSASEARSHIGYMAQKFSLYDNLSVKENLEFFSGIYNLWGEERKRAIEDVINIFNFTPYLDESAEILPLGFKQRLALSCAVMHRPAILFLDEPTSGVDPKTRREFWSHINGLVEKGVTVLITTHFMDEAEYCDRIALVYRSKLITMGTPEHLKEQAKTLENPSPTLEEAFIHLIETQEEVGS